MHRFPQVSFSSLYGWLVFRSPASEQGKEIYNNYRSILSATSFRGNVYTLAINYAFRSYNLRTIFGALNQEELHTMLKQLARAFFLSLLTSGTATFAQSAADLYKTKCQMCHAADGSGNTPAGKSLKAPAFSSPEIMKATDADLIAATENGKGKMPAYKGKLTDGQIKDLIAYVRTLEKQ
jgi:cytochrome c553